MSQSLDQLIELEEEDLLEKLGTELVGFQAVPLTAKQLRQLAQNWFRANSQKISDQICTSKKIYSLANGSRKSKELVLAICDLIISIQFGVSPLLVAVLVVKVGLDKICQSYWSDSNEV